MKPRWLVLLMTWPVLLTSPAGADAPADVEKRLRSDLQLLTSDDCEGRGITTKGINIAAGHIAREFEKAGLRPGMGRSYFQPFTLTTSARAGKNNRLALRGPQGQTFLLERDRHFSIPLMASTGKVDAGLVFAGYGITSPSPKYDDYAGLDVKGKLVVVLSGKPRPAAGSTDELTRGLVPLASLPSKLSNASRRGAAAVLVVNNRLTAQPPTRGRRGGDVFPFAARLFSMRDTQPAGLPLAYLKRDWLDRMLVSAGGRPLEEVEKEIDARLEPQSRALPGWSCAMETEVNHTTVTVKNVIGVLEGKGPLAKETVVVGAHYDHIGMGSTRSLPTPNPFMPAFRGGRVAGPGAPGGVGFPMGATATASVHHGADDNASGTVAVLELARRFGASKERQGRRLVFIAFTAEEIGLIGSARYCKSPAFPLADTVAMINMDMVGRLQDDRLLVSGLGTAKMFPELVARHNARHRFVLDKENAGNGPSDHSSFFAVGVPVLNFFTGFHEQYHRPTDRLETINVPGLRRVTDLVGDLVDELGRAPSRPIFIRATGSFDRTKTLWSMAPSTGIVPRHTDNRDGMLIDAVIGQTVAARAGLKKGDRVIAANGTAIAEAGTFLRLSRTWKPGSKVELAVLRDGKEQKVALELAPLPRGGGRGGPLGLALDLRGEGGIRLGQVAQDSAAAKAGLKAGDRIVAIDGREVSTLRDLAQAARAVPPGTKVELTVLRDGKRSTHLLQAPQPVGPAGTPPIGFSARGVAGKEGLFVTGLAKDSPASRAGLAEGDRIVSVNGQPVQTTQDYLRIVRGLGTAASTEVVVEHDGKKVTRTLKLR